MASLANAQPKAKGSLDSLFQDELSGRSVD
jgi:hypothetical protein